MNMLLHHGVRSCLEYAQSGDIARARALSNRDLSPHVSLWIWAGTDIRWCERLGMPSKRSSFAFRARSNAATARMAVRCGIGSGFGRRFGEGENAKTGNADT